MNGSKLAIKCRCKNCGHEFEVSKWNLMKSKIDVNGQSIYLTYYDCPECGRRRYCQIDNTASLQELKSIKRQMDKLMALKRRGKTIPQNQSAKFKKTQEHLTRIRTVLMEQYTGKLIHDNDTDTDFELEFSFQGE